VEGAGFPFPVESLEDGVDDAIHALDIYKTDHGPSPPPHFHDAALDDVGGAQFAPQVPGKSEERQQLGQVLKMRNILEKTRKRDYDEVKAGPTPPWFDGCSRAGQYLRTEPAWEHTLKGIEGGKRTVGNERCAIKMDVDTIAAAIQVAPRPREGNIPPE